jgi:UTP:GlnB (protein PII) uridylyltransferase
MGTEEKLYKKIQQAAENAEQKDFPGMEKIWARVEDKMETQTLQKEKHLWKKLAVAASVVLVGTLTFFLLQEKETIIVPENTVTTIDSSKKVIPTPESANGFVNTTPEIKKEAEQILQQQIVIQNNIVINDTINYKSKKEVMIPVPIAMEEVQEMAKTSLVPTYNNNISNSASANDSGYLAKGKRYDLANSVNLLKENDKKVTNEDLTLVDGKLTKESLSNLNPDDIDSIIELKEPIYFINGVEYSEESLFGENPTSPYAPLNKQKIEKIEVIQPADAIKIYGKKGEKGVVIISIKK